MPSASISKPEKDRRKVFLQDFLQELDWIFKKPFFLNFGFNIKSKICIKSMLETGT
jgi:hypothetical protein